MSFFIKAATLALQEYPVVNSVIEGNEIIRRNYINISIAVATPTGLMVPVLRNCQNLKFHEMDRKIIGNGSTWEKRKRRKKYQLRICKAVPSQYRMEVWIIDGDSNIKPSSKCYIKDAFDHQQTSCEGYWDSGKANDVRSIGIRSSIAGR